MSLKTEKNPKYHFCPVTWKSGNYHIIAQAGNEIKIKFHQNSICNFTATAEWIQIWADVSESLGFINTETLFPFGVKKSFFTLNMRTVKLRAWQGQSRWGDIAKRPVHSLQLPMTDALTCENLFIYGGNDIHWRTKVKWWTKYQVKQRNFLGDIILCFFFLRQTNNVMLPMFWVQNSGRYWGVPSLFYITESVANDLSRSVLCSSTPSHPATVSLEKSYQLSR